MEWGGGLSTKNAFIFKQYQLHDLVLVDHVDRDVARLGLGPQQGWSEHDGHALGGHAVGLSVFNHPGGVGGEGVGGERGRERRWNMTSVS